MGGLHQEEKLFHVHQKDPETSSVSMMSAFSLGKLEHREERSTLEINVSFFSSHLLNQVAIFIRSLFCKGLQEHSLLPGVKG